MTEATHSHAGHDHAGHDHAEDKKLSPVCEVSEAGPCKLKLRVEIAAARVKEEVDGKYRELNETMALPGFRKGHAPRAIMERKFGKALLEDLRFELVNRAFEEVREEKKLEPVAEPHIEIDKLVVEEGKAFAFEFTLEIRPKVELKNWEGVKVVKPPLAAEDKDVEAVLRGYQESKAELVSAEDGVAREHDQLTADFQLSEGGHAVDTAENTALFLDSEITFYNVPLPDFHKAVEGKKAGDVVDVPVKLPDDFPKKNHAGKDAVLKVTVKGLKRKKLPEIDAEFLKSFDMDTLDELKEDIRKKVLREKETHARAAMADQVVDAIVQENSFPLPEGLVISGAEEALRRMHLDLAMKGVGEEEIKKSVEEQKNQSKEGMEKALRIHFILEHIAAKEKIFVTEDQVEERIGQIATQYGKWPHEMKAYLEEQGLLAQLRRRMREELVREFLLSKAVIEEKAP